MKIFRSMVLIALTAAGGMFVAAAAEEADQAALGQALQGVKATLQGGLQASEREGRPISGKFEMEDGKLQLSVYTMKNGGFMEVVLDPMTGAIAKADKITEGDDLKAAKEQSAAMAKAKRSLGSATETAIASNAGARAVSIVPELKGGRPVGQITVQQGGNFKTIEVPLD